MCGSLKGVVVDEAKVSTILAIVAVLIFVIALGGTMWVLGHQ